MPIFWLLLFILILAKRKNLYLYLRIACIFIYISLTPIFSTLLEFPLLMNLNNYEKQEKYSLALVPTAGIYQDFQSKWHPSSKTVQRISMGEKLARELNIPLLISGGIVNNYSISEASAVKKYILYKNVFYDHESKNSYETVKNLSKVFKFTSPNETVLLITSPKHVLRMTLILSSHGYSVYNYTKKLEKPFNYKLFFPDVRTIQTNNASLYEYIAILQYIYLKYIKISIFHE